MAVNCKGWEPCGREPQWHWDFVWGCIPVNAQGAQWDCRCIPVNAQGDQRNCTVSGDEPGVQRDCVDECVRISEWQVCWCMCVCIRMAGVHRLGCGLVHQSAHLLYPLDEESRWRILDANRGAGRSSQRGATRPSSTHCTTAVAYRQCSRWHGRGGASWGWAFLDISVRVTVWNVTKCHKTVALF